jgi:tRNA1Val (adenine37-N6)-methyltransferase
MSANRKKERLFRFKQFSIRHEKSGMKVGTDGVLLGAWTDVNDAKQILDIGTGSGVIALMLAQRTNEQTHLDAIEIDTLAYEEAKENIEASPWREKIKIHLCAVQDFRVHKRYDLIVSNPPYFQNSFKPPDAKRVVARHTENLSFTDLLNAAEYLLAANGRLNVILPTTEGDYFEALAAAKNFTLTRKWSFRTRHEKPVERWLMEFSKHSKPTQTGEILLYNQGEEWSDEYRQLTRDFYLKA